MYAGKRDEDRSRAEKAFEDATKLLEGLEVDRKFVVLKDAVNAIAREVYEHYIVLIGHKVVGL